jgi:hypothetical protein
VLLQVAVLVNSKHRQSQLVQAEALGRVVAPRVTRMKVQLKFIYLSRMRTVHMYLVIHMPRSLIHTMYASCDSCDVHQ